MAALDEQIAELIAGTINDGGSTDVRRTEHLIVMVMKILFMQSQQFVGADTQIHLSLMRHLSRTDFDVHCATISPVNGKFADSARAVQSLDHVHVRPTQFGPTLERATPQTVLNSIVRQGLPTVASLIGLARYIRREEIQVVHCTEKTRSAFYGYLISRLGGAKCVIHVHTNPGPWFRTLVIRAMRRADALVGVSQFVSDSIIDLVGDGRHVHTVHNGLTLANWPETEQDTIADKRRELGVFVDAPLLLTASRLVSSKGQHHILKALPEVKRHFPDVVLLIVGHDDPRGQPTTSGSGSYTELLQKLVQELGLQDNVVFLGWRKDMTELMSASDVFVMPSYAEPFGMVYLEAMAMRRPVIALNHGGAREIVDHGASGLLSEVDDDDGLASNIIALLADPELRRRMGEHGRHRVIAKFSATEMAERMGAVYSQLLDATPESPVGVLEPSV